MWGRNEWFEVDLKEKAWVGEKDGEEMCFKEKGECFGVRERKWNFANEERECDSSAELDQITKPNQQNYSIV